MTLDAPWSDANGDEMERGDADPPSPLTALAAIVHDDIANGRTDEEIARHVLDAARAPDAGLRAAAQEVLDRWDGYLVGDFGRVPNQEEVDRLRAALASSPAPAGLHPDDGHEHWYACIRCGVDNGINETPAPAGLDVELSAAWFHPMTCDRHPDSVPPDQRRCVRVAAAVRAATRPAEDAKP